MVSGCNKRVADSAAVLEAASEVLAGMSGLGAGSKRQHRARNAALALMSLSLVTMAGVAGYTQLPDSWYHGLVDKIRAALTGFAARAIISLKEVEAKLLNKLDEVTKRKSRINRRIVARTAETERVKERVNQAEDKRGQSFEVPELEGGDISASNSLVDFLGELNSVHSILEGFDEENKSLSHGVSIEYVDMPENYAEVDDSINENAVEDLLVMEQPHAEECEEAPIEDESVSEVPLHALPSNHPQPCLANVAQAPADCPRLACEPDPIPQGDLAYYQDVINALPRRDPRRGKLLQQLNNLKQKQAQVEKLSGELEGSLEELKMIIRDPEPARPPVVTVPAVPQVNETPVQDALREDPVKRQEVAMKGAELNFKTEKFYEHIKPFLNFIRSPSRYATRLYHSGFSTNGSQSLDVKSENSGNDSAGQTTQFTGQLSKMMEKILCHLTESTLPWMRHSMGCTQLVSLMRSVGIPYLRANIKNSHNCETVFSYWLRDVKLGTLDLISAGLTFALPRSAILRTAIPLFVPKEERNVSCIVRKLLCNALAHSLRNRLKLALQRICKLGSITRLALTVVIASTSNWLSELCMKPRKSLLKKTLTLVNGILCPVFLSALNWQRESEIRSLLASHLSVIPTLSTKTGNRQ